MSVIKIPKTFHMILGKKDRYSVVPVLGETYTVATGPLSAVRRAIRLNTEDSSNPHVVYNHKGKLVYRPALV